jgi:DNA-binding Lrp family transcriptional regulator
LKIDDLDVRLLNMLQKDSSAPLVRIASSLHVTEGTVRNRIRRLRRTGVIKRFTISVDSAAMGQATVAFVLLNAVPGRLADVAKKLSAIEVVSDVYETHTYGDLLLKVRAKNPSELAGILGDRIKTIPGVAGTQVITVLNAWKESA